MAPSTVQVTLIAGWGFFIFYFKLCLYSPLPEHRPELLSQFFMFPSLSARQVLCVSGRPVLTFWRRIFFLNFSTPCI